MPQEGTPYLIPFGAHGMVAHPNRWLAKPGEVTLAENVVFENDMAQKEPSASYYSSPAAVSNGLVGNSTLGATTLVAMGFPSTGATTATGGLATGSTAPGTSWVITTTGGASVGELYVVGFSREAGTGGVSALIDSKGNTYTRQIGFDGSSGMRLEVWTSLLTVALTGADTLTFTLDDGTADVNAVTVRYTGITSASAIQAVGHDDAGGGFTSPTVQSVILPLLLVQVVASTDAATVFTFSNGFVSVVNTNLGAHQTHQVWRLDFGYPGVLGLAEFAPEAESSPAGTITTTVNGVTVTGSGTSWNSTMRVGDEIIASGETHRVAKISGNTSLDTTSPWSQALSGVAYTRRAGPVIVMFNTERNTAGNIVGAWFKERPSNTSITANRGSLRNDSLNITLNPTPRSVRFVIGGKEVAANPRKLFLFTGVDPVRVLSGDGTSDTAISNPAADWGAAVDPGKQPINGIVHQDSLMAFGNNNDPHRLYISSPSDHENFTSAGGGITIKIASQIGRGLYAAAVYQGVLFLWKYPEGIFYLDDTPIDRFQWGYRIKSRGVGSAPSPHAVVSIDDDVIFCDANGHFHLLSAVDTLGGTRDSDLTRTFGLQEWTRQNVDTSFLNQLVSAYDPDTKTVWFGLRSKTSQISGFNDLIVRWDFSGPEPRMSTARQWRPQSLATKHRDIIGQSATLIGESHNVWFTIPSQYGTRTNPSSTVGGEDVNIGVASRVDLPEHDFDEQNARLRHIQKHFTALEVVFQGTLVSHPLTVELRIDGVLRDTLTFNSTDRRRVMKVLSCGSGYTITARLTTTGSVVGDLPMVGLIVYYKPTSSDMSRPN